MYAARPVVFATVLRGCLKSPDSRQILSSMCLLQLPESWHEARTPSVNLALAGLFKHPLNAVTVDDKLAALILVAVGTLAIIYVVGELRW